jgi:hypothetical protein
MKFVEFYGLSNGTIFVEFERVLIEKIDIVLICADFVRNGDGRRVIFCGF